jgi:hypothetical protein
LILPSPHFANHRDDIYAQESIDLLARSGVDFRKHEEQGIDTHEFGALFMMSGVVLNDNVKWISFHSGYDFAYLLKVLSCQPLPDDDSEFFELLRLFFPCLFDLKHMMRSCQSLRGGLQQLADDLKVPGFSVSGSCALIVSFIFFSREFFFSGCAHRSSTPSRQRQLVDVYGVLQDAQCLFREQNRRGKVFDADLRSSTKPQVQKMNRTFCF